MKRSTKRANWRADCFLWCQTRKGLMSALQQWAGEVEDLFAVSCRFQCFTPVLIHDDTVATHLYYIAREAVNNAIKHGHAQQIVIRLAADQTTGSAYHSG